jgi:uncharacterized protein with von Willebrand factor type A (vWA) domain
MQIYNFSINVGMPETLFLRNNKKHQASPKKHQGGPVIVCIDTSSSINGEPVMVAKTLAIVCDSVWTYENGECMEVKST